MFPSLLTPLLLGNYCSPNIIWPRRRVYEAIVGFYASALVVSLLLFYFPAKIPQVANTPLKILLILPRAGNYSNEFARNPITLKGLQQLPDPPLRLVQASSAADLALVRSKCLEVLPPALMAILAQRPQVLRIISAAPLSGNPQAYLKNHLMINWRPSAHCAAS